METKKSSLQAGSSVAEVLNRLRDEVIEELTEAFIRRRASGYNDTDVEELERLARIAGNVARTKAGTAIGEAYQIGANKNATTEDFNRETVPTPSPKKG